MNPLRQSTLGLLMLGLWGILGPSRALADDIDIFLGTSAGSKGAPNVMILLDNTSNWDRKSQAWQDSNGNKISQGQAELSAVSSVISYLKTQNQSINVGLAMLVPDGGYIRFAARDVTVAANATALQNIVNLIYNNTNGDKVAIAHKDETAALYEIYKYYSGLAPYQGALANAPLVDVSGNNGGGPTGSSGVTANAQGLTSGFAISGGLYVSPITPSTTCSSSYIIYIANNTNGTTGSTANVYEPSVVAALSALTSTGGGDTWTDEWTRFLYRNGAVVPAGNTNGSIVTYVLDAYDAQNNAGYSTSLQAAAAQGGGSYHQVGSTTAITTQLQDIFVEIQAINSTFTSASLPISSAARTQDLNQVFLTMFRPDAHSQPRWFGNLKEYQLVASGGSIVLGDATGASALDPLTGFATACATSFWTTDSTDATNYPSGYWNYTPEADFAKGTCPTAAYGVYTDSPDGPFVEKGGAAEVIRKGNNPPTTNTTPTWSPSLRTVYTLNGLASTSLVAFNTANTGLNSTLVNWVLGQDVQDENANGKTTTETRPSVHGDSIHSKPAAVDYGSGSVYVYYGSNDGTLRAVNASNGKEAWAFVAPEFYTPAPAVYPGTTPTGFERLMWSGMLDASNNQISPLVNFPGIASGLTPTPTQKDYYFDGSVGLYQTADNSKIYIYPSMRRGGRMVYAFNVTTPTSPTVLWKAGCPYLSSNTGCTTGMTGIGQTWSTPVVATSVLGYGSPVVIVGGGYDSCEDANTSSPSCGSETGAAIYVLDAATGSIVKSFTTTRAVAADVALIGVANNAIVDHAYAVDTGGNIYRIDFASAVGSWVINRVAYTNGSGRKFLFAPALLAAPSNQVYVAVGSGDREHPLQSEYPYSSVTNRFYVYRDNLASTTATNLDDVTVMNDFTSTTLCSTSGVLPTSTFKGWFMNLNAYGTGEQTVTSAVIVSGLVAFSTNRPIPQVSGSCSNVLGQANGYFVNLFNASGGIGVSGASCGGTRATSFVGGGLPGSPALASVTVNGQVDQVIIGAAQLSGAASSPIGPQQIKPAIVPKRKTIFWKASGQN